MGKCIFNRTKKELEDGVCRFCSVMFCDVRYENRQIARTDNKVIEEQKKMGGVI